MREIAHEFCAPANELMNLRSDGVHPLQMYAVVDACSVFSGITCEHTKATQEAHTLYHAQWCRELIDLRVLHQLWWCDTRNMLANSMNEGSVPRAALIEAMTGRWTCQRKVVCWPKRSS